MMVYVVGRLLSLLVEKLDLILESPLTTMGVLALGSLHARPSALPPIDVSEKISAHKPLGSTNFPKFF